MVGDDDCWSEKAALELVGGGGCLTAVEWKNRGEGGVVVAGVDVGKN